MIKVRLSNINLFVADVDRSARFYEAVFGLVRDQTTPATPGFAYLDGGSISLTLQGPEAPGAVLGQSESVEIGFEVEAADLTSLRLALEAEGVEISPTQVMGWGSTFDARDPNGFRITVYTKQPDES